jgi:hypothetical protein
MFAGLGVVAHPAGAVTTFAVGTDHATCNTLTGTIKFTQHLKNSGPTTGAQTTTAALKLAGCFDDDNSNVHMFKGATTAKLIGNNGWNCAGLLGPTNTSGASDLLWTPAAGQKFTPTITVGTLQKQGTHVTFSQVSGGTFTVPAANAPWNASYGFFAIGTAYGTTPLSSTGEFRGSDNGATSWFAGTTAQDLGYILTTCGTTAGVALLNFGIGAVHGG